MTARIIHMNLPRLTSQAVFALLLLVVGGITQAKAQAYLYDPTYNPRVSAAINVSPVPTFELGVGIASHLSLHVKGGYLPDLDSSEKYNTEVWLVSPTLRWWQGVHRYEDFYLEGGILFNQFDFRLPYWNSYGYGERGNQIGFDIGGGYFRALSEHFRIGVHLNLFAGISLISDTLVPDESGHLVSKPHETRRLSIPYFMPYNTGVSLMYVF